MTGILHAAELTHFASMAAFVGLAVTLIFGCFIIRFASAPPSRRRGSSAHGTKAVNNRCPSACSANSRSPLARPHQGRTPQRKPADKR